MEEMIDSKKLSEVALGNLAPDTVLKNGTVFNVFTGEFIPGQSIWIKDGVIAYVGPDHNPPNGKAKQIIDVDGMVVLPGLIDGHTHLSTCHSLVEEFVRYIIPRGVTTVIAETIELASVVGKPGIEYYVRGFENQPIRFYYTIPALCGLTLEEEKPAPPNEELIPFLKDPKCLGLGEIYWSNMFLEGKQGERVRELASLTLQYGKRVEGHTAGASGRKLQAYTCFGISSCHEPITASEVLERLRLGYWVMVREGSIRKELQGVREIFTKDIDFRRLTLSTDGVDPKALIEEGHLDASVRRALNLGVPPHIAYQMVTINVAEHFRLDHLIGSLSPGKMGDALVIPSVNEFTPKMVMVGGRVVFQEGKALVQPRKTTFPEWMLRMVKLGEYSLPTLPNHGKVRVMDLISDLVTQETIVDLDDPTVSKGLNIILAMDRLGSGRIFAGFIRGFGLQSGAMGTTLSWDSPDLIVVGCDISSIKTVIERLRQTGGGTAYAIGNEVLSELPASLCGLLSLKSMPLVREEQKQLEETLRRYGVKWEKPLLTVSTLSTAAIPHLRITHSGYVRLRDRKILPIEL